jgi:ribonuclease P protein component
MTTVLRIRKRDDFLRAQKAKNSIATAGLVLQAVPSKIASEAELRLGFTATTKVGNAVRRNRIKRRLRAVAREVMCQCALPGQDYVIIGRFRAFDREFEGLVKDLKYALHNTGTFKKDI